MLRWVEPLGRAALYTVSHAAVVVAGGNVYSFGGYRGYHWGMEDRDEERSIPGQMDVHVFNTVALRWIKLPTVTTKAGQRPAEVPPARINHTAVLIENTVYVCGGTIFPSRCEESGIELHGFDVAAHRWFRPEVCGTEPPHMKCHSACVVGKVMYVYGAWYSLIYEPCKDWMPHADIYKLDTSTMVWSLINTGGTAPPVSLSHSATVIGAKMFVFGGGPSSHCYGRDNLFDNIRVFDTETNCWLSSRTPAQPHPEGGRESHAAFAYNGELYIFAGESWQSYFNDLWKFNPETFCWKKVEAKGKQPSKRCRMCSCMVGDRIIIFGGIWYDRPCDLLILDLSPGLKTLCKLVVLQYGLEQSELPHDIRWELAAMTDNISGPISSDLVPLRDFGRIERLLPA